MTPGSDILRAGCGKTELSRRFESNGFDVLDEAFLDLPSYGLHPQSLVMETTWIVSWFARLLKKAQAIKDSGGSHASTVFIADRSPFSAVFYCHYGELLKPIIERQVEEVRSAADVHIYSLHVKVEAEVLWARVEERLKLEPERALYKEDKREWMDTVKSFYDSFAWDVVVDNSEEDASGTLLALTHRAVRSACAALPQFEKAFIGAAPKLHRAAVLAAKAEAEAEGSSAALALEEKHKEEEGAAGPRVVVTQATGTNSKRIQAGSVTA